MNSDVQPQAVEREPSACSPAPPSPVVEVADLRVRFPSRDRTIHAVNGVSFAVDAGQTLAIIGESGSGKSVTSRAIMGLLPETARVTGSVTLLGEQVLGQDERQLRRRRGTDMAMVFQDPARSLNPTKRIGAQISEAIRTHLPLDKRQAKERTVELLRMVRVPSPVERYHEYPHQLSGGMRQRVMIAMALACGPKLLIADEATTALDVTTQAQIMDLLMDLQSELHMGLIVVSHNMALAATYADRVIVMYAGAVVEQAATIDLFRNVRMPYTHALLGAVPRLELPPHTRFQMARGGQPDLTREPQSCAFASRCERVQPRCHAELPQLEERDVGHGCACFYPLGEQEPAT